MVAKTYRNYQTIGVRPMDAYDERDKDSKFWNRGKWDNFIAPLLPRDEEMTLVDLGCNAGLYCKMAEDWGFQRVIGIDCHKEAMRQALRFRQKSRGRYQLKLSYIQRSVDVLPVADVVLMANIHYHLAIQDLFYLLDRLQDRARFCLVVTVERKHAKLPKASPAVDDLRRYFRSWDEVGLVGPIPSDGDPSPRNLRSLCFRNPLVRRLPLEDLAGNDAVDKFFEEVGDGVNPIETDYFRFLVKEPKNSRWPAAKFEAFVRDKVALLENMRENGQTEPIIVDRRMRILNGRHRYSIMKHLGCKTVMARMA